MLHDARTQVSVATIIVPCSSRKTVPSMPKGRAVSLPCSEQAALETAWQKRLKTLETVCAAGALYAGRGAYLGREAAIASGARLFFVSAGLGLVASDRQVPSYAITVADRGPDALVSRTTGGFDPASWWRSVDSGQYATPLAGVFDRPGRCLVALTQPYALMIADVLAILSSDEVAQLRLFGWRLNDVLPSALHGSIMPYDRRLDAVFPGTQTDFAQRALRHFQCEVVGSAGRKDAVADRAAVERALAPLSAPVRPVRPRVADGDILRWIDAHPGEGIQRLLRRIRHEGIACEQARFSRLFRQTRKGEVAA